MNKIGFGGRVGLGIIKITINSVKHSIKVGTTVYYYDEPLSFIRTLREFIELVKSNPSIEFEIEE